MCEGCLIYIYIYFFLACGEAIYSLLPEMFINTVFLLNSNVHGASPQSEFESLFKGDFPASGSHEMNIKQ